MLFPGVSQKLDAGNQLALIEELHKEIRFIGNESKGEHVPGFCLPKKVSQGPGQGPAGVWPSSAFPRPPCWGRWSSCVLLHGVLWVLLHISTDSMLLPHGGPAGTGSEFTTSFQLWRSPQSR